MKKIISIFVLLFMVSSVSANMCDDAINDGLLQSQPELFDINNDGVTDLTDVALFAANRNNESFCNDLLNGYYNKPIPAASSGNFGPYNLDRRSTVEMSRNIPFLWREGISREIQYKGERYIIGFDGRNVNFYEKYTGEKVNLDGVNIEVNYRTFWTRTLIFTKV